MKIVNDDDTQGKYTMNILRVGLLGDCEIPFCGWMDDVFQVKFLLFLIRQGIGFDYKGVILNVANVIQI